MSDGWPPVCLRALAGCGLRRKQAASTRNERQALLPEQFSLEEHVTKPPPAERARGYAILVAVHSGYCRYSC